MVVGAAAVALICNEAQPQDEVMTGSDGGRRGCDLAVRHAASSRPVTTSAAASRITGVKGRFVSLPRQTPFSFWVKPDI